MAGKKKKKGKYESSVFLLLFVVRVLWAFCSPMASSNSTTGVDNTFRKKFDTEEYQEREKKESDRSKSRSKGPPYVQRAPLKHRDYHVDLESRLGKTQVVTLSKQVGYFCRVCDCVVKDSANYLDHINGKKHQRTLACLCGWRDLQLEALDLQENHDDYLVISMF